MTRSPEHDVLDADRTERSRWIPRSPRGRLVMIALAFAAMQLALVGVDRAPSWDEAIYLSQVTPGAEAMNFAAFRSRGITYLVAGPLGLGASLGAVRLLLTAASAAALAGAFLPWIEVVGVGAIAAAAVFGSGWIALFYGSEVMPNLWVALLGVAAIGFVARRTVGSGASRDVPIAAALFAAAAVVRPFDAAILGAIGIVLVLLAGPERVRSGAIVAAGLAVGALPWVLEVVTRYGGLREAVEQAAGVGGLGPTGPIEATVQYLATADGPPIGPEADPTVAAGTVAALLVGIGLTAFAVVRVGDRRAAVPLAVAGGGALLSFAVYVTFVGAIAPRFLAPALGLLAVVVGTGLVEAWRRARSSVPGRAVLAVGAVAWLLWQSAIAMGVAGDARTQRALLAQLGVAIRSAAAPDHPCAIVSVTGFPQIGYPSGCRGRPFPRSGSLPDTVAEEQRRGTHTLFVILDAPPVRIGEAAAARIDVPTRSGLLVYRIALRS